MTDQELRDIVAGLAVSQKQAEAEFVEIRAGLKSLSTASAETDARIKFLAEKTDAQFAETDARIKFLAEKTDAQFAETDARMKFLAEKTDAQFAETDARMKFLAEKTDTQFAETDVRIKSLSEMYGGASNNQGDVVEEFYFNSLADTLTLNGIRFDYIDKNVSRSSNGLRGEYDILLINGSDVFVLEVKYKAQIKHVEHMLHVQKPAFEQLFPQYRQYKQHWGLAAFHFSEDVKNTALQQGINVLQRKGSVIETISA